MHLPALGAQRRLEARIGELLGKPEHGGDRKSDQVTHAKLEVGRAADRSDFRILARALDGSTDLTADEWRQSRPRPIPSASLGA